YRKGKENVNPAKNRTLGALSHGIVLCVGDETVEVYWPLAAELATTVASCLSICAHPYSAPWNAASADGRDRSKPVCSRTRRVPSPSGSSWKLTRVSTTGPPADQEKASRPGGSHSNTSQLTTNPSNPAAGFGGTRNVKRWPTRGSKSLGNIHSARVARAVSARQTSSRGCAHR